MIDTTIELSLMSNEKFRELEDWLRLNNVKYESVRSPYWVNTPSAFRMSSENALAFRLKFGELS